MRVHKAYREIAEVLEGLSWVEFCRHGFNLGFLVDDNPARNINEEEKKLLLKELIRIKFYQVDSYNIVEYEERIEQVSLERRRSHKDNASQSEEEENEINTHLSSLGNSNSNSLNMTPPQSTSLDLTSPTVKTLFNVSSTVLVGVFASSFVAELSTPNGINWKHFYKTTSIYILLAVSAVIYFYNRHRHLQEVEVEKFYDKEYCLAYMRSKYIPQLAKHYNKLIQEGDLDQLEKAMADFKESLI